MNRDVWVYVLDFQFPSREELYQTTKSILRNYAIFPQKMYGQHFLIEPAVMEDLFLLSNLNANDFVIEIGGGLGTLTDQLGKVARQVIVFEKDPTLSVILERRFSSKKNVEIINQDFLESELDEFEPFKLIANPPYELSSPIIFKSLSSKKLISQTLTLQKEYVERMVAEVGSNEYGKLSLSLSLRATIETGRTFPPASFWPKPKIASTVVHLDPKRQIPSFINSDKFDQLLTVLFNRKNKYIKNNIQAGLDILGIDRKNKKNALNVVKNEYSQIRSRKLTRNDVLKIYELLCPYL